MSVDITAVEVKDRLRRRYAAVQGMGVRTIPGPWTCVEELLDCDLLAVSAIKKPLNGPKGVGYPMVGHEVKVSRSDYRTELRNPHKRERAVGWTHAFYFVVPAGLLAPEERSRREPWPDDPKLWVPADVGLIEVRSNGCSVVHQSPVRKVPVALTAGEFGKLVRFVSSHPDPRHEGVVAADRVLCKQLRDRERAAKVEGARRHQEHVERMAALGRPHAGMSVGDARRTLARQGSIPSPSGPAVPGVPETREEVDGNG